MSNTENNGMSQHSCELMTLTKCPAQSWAQNETKNNCFELPRRTLNARCFYYYQLLRETVITKWKRLAHVWLRTTSLPI